MSHAGERQLWLDLYDERRAFISLIPADRRERRLAAWTVGVSALIFLAAAPFAKTALPHVWAFIPLYQSALVMGDLVTAALLLGQFSILKSRALLILASGYLFAAFMAIAHALSFPGLFSPSGLLGSGPQTTAWLYMFWHAGFPLFVCAFALLKDRTMEEGGVRIHTFGMVLAGIAAAIAAACMLTFLATVGHDRLPALMLGHSDDWPKVIAATGTWLVSALALGLLWRRRPHSVLDLWLMVVLCAWLFDIGLSAVFNAGRFDLGFYAGRVYGLLAASFVLVVLLIDNGVLYGRLAAAYTSERSERQSAQMRGAELQAVNNELDAFSYSVSHDLRAPLRAVNGYARMLEEDHGQALDQEGRRLLGVVRSSAARMSELIDDLLEFSRLGRQAPVKSRVDMTALAREVAAGLAAEAPRAHLRIAELPPATVDRSLCRQVWANLIENAFKYSGKRDRPEVEIGAKRGDDGQIVYWVRDNGAGFDMRYAGKLFGVFQRLHQAGEFPGTGVGLAIVQRVVAKHGGRTWAEAEPGKGACFYFSLPEEGSGAAR